ncbi:MAG: DUF4476 domain-containing protein [Alphaproteobacteria bacterium]|nr:DUF4476 domain-containing protein [Alphaproteobacteria bacterium]
MLLPLLALLSAPAQAGEIQVLTATPVLVKVDGQVLEYPEGSMTVTAPGLAGGAHLIEISSLTGKPITALRVDVPVHEQLRMQYKQKTLSVLGSGPLPGATPPPGGSVAISVNDPTMDMLSALGYVETETTTASVSSSAGGASVSVTVTTGGTQPAPQAPVVVGPPPPPVVAPMAPGPFDGLIRAISAESFGDDKLDVLRSAAAGNHFTCAQLGRIIDQFSFSDEQVEAVRIVRPKIVDPQNAYTLNEHLTFSSDKEKVQALFR